MENNKLEAAINLFKMVIQANMDGHCVFMNISGHVDWMDFTIAESKDNYKVNVFCKDFIEFNRDDFIKKINECIDAINHHCKKVF